ncbi:hypothetical protein IWQ60_004386 [Tieghemiomyces parasiticus]|uniref:Arrestin C-terminal-like domain-containing protein n=1 Tax=Tieghemiomyces parasiticus TaxID=78921 RepID=A0A9W8AB18_9FUNG|nr:hypothetical protein IWQ60_004386 [Tieghemiomyces parasiticus]
MRVERINGNPTAPSFQSSTAVQLASNQWLEQTYFQRDSILLGNPDDEASSVFLEPGLHMYHFALNMPFMNYPTSIRTPEFEIVYTLTARLECPRDEIPVKYSLPAAIHFEPLSLVVPHLPDSLKNFTTNVLDGDKVLYHLHANFMKNSFGPGEPFALSLIIKPVTQRPIKSARIMLKEYVTCHLRNEFDQTEKPLWHNQRVIHHDILLLNRTPSDVGRDPYQAIVSFELPDFFQPNNTIYLTFQYTLCLALKVSTGFLITGSRELLTEIPINIVRPEKASVSRVSATRPGDAVSLSPSRESATYAPSLQSEMLNFTPFNPHTLGLEAESSSPVMYSLRSALPFVHPPSVKDISVPNDMPVPQLEQLMLSVNLGKPSHKSSYAIHTPPSRQATPPPPPPSSTTASTPPPSSTANSSVGLVSPAMRPSFDDAEEMLSPTSGSVIMTNTPTAAIVTANTLTAATEALTEDGLAQSMARGTSKRHINFMGIREAFVGTVSGSKTASASHLHHHHRRHPSYEDQDDSDDIPGTLAALSKRKGGSSSRSSLVGLYRGSHASDSGCNSSVSSLVSSSPIVHHSITVLPIGPSGPAPSAPALVAHPREGRVEAPTPRNPPAALLYDTVRGSAAPHTSPSLSSIGSNP